MPTCDWIDPGPLFHWPQGAENFEVQLSNRHMHVKKPVTENLFSVLFIRNKVVTLLAVLYVVGASLAAWNIISRTEASTKAIEQILTTYNMKNEGEQAIDRYANEHPLLGLFLASPVKSELELPSHDESTKALSSDLRQYLKSVRQESSVAAWWSWFLLNFSLAYAVTVIALQRSLTTPAVLFSLAAVSIVFFVIGVLAPAMVIWTAPTIPMASGDFSFVLQHQVRGIAAIIKELITTGHWIVGGLLLLFSIVTPLTKASLTFFVAASPARDLNYKIGQFLHTIGKWSMADVFVAGVLLSLYALKAQEATKSIPCLGIYYFIGYCLLSMTTTELLVHSGAVAGNAVTGSENKFGSRWIGGLVALLLCFVVGSTLYTYEQYTVNTKQKVEASSSPESLNNSDLVLPAHK
jgi:paraquat-inducible protein A